MADPEQIYQEVLQEEQSKGSATAVAEGRAKAARLRAEHGSPHPKEPKWWPGAQPHLEGGDGAAPVEEVAEAPAEEPAAEAPSEEPAAEAAPAEAPAEQPAAEAPAEQPAAEAPAEPAAAEAPAEPAAAEAPAEQPAAQQPAAAAPAADQEAARGAETTAPAAAAGTAAAPAAVAEEPQPGHQQVTGVTHGTPTGSRLRPEDGVATEAQFEGQRAMYERRKLIDELIATGVPAAAAADAGRPRAPWLAILYLIIPLVVVGFILANYGDAESTAGTAGEEQTGGETGGGGGGTTIVAQAIQFDTESIEVKAKQETDYTLVNEDTVTHDLAIFESEQDATGGADPLFKSPDVDAGAEETFAIPPLDKGDYYFLCTFHPTQMTGTVTAQ